MYLKHGSRLASDETLVGDLDSHGDHVVEFEAITPSDLSTRLPEDRDPLQPLSSNAKISTHCQVDKVWSKHRSKSRRDVEAATLPSPSSASPSNYNNKSSLNSPHETLATATPAIKTETTVTNDPITDPIQKMEHVKSENPQFARYLEYNQQRIMEEKPGSKDLDVHDIAWQEWASLDTSSRAKYYIKSEPPAESHESPYTASLDLGDSVLQHDESRADHDDAPKSFQLRSLVADASLELLETSVERGLQLLDDLKGPLKSRFELSPDAVRWIEQIERLQKSAVKTKTIIGVSQWQA